MIATPLRLRGGPLFPIDCPVCGRRLGAFYREGLTLKPSVQQCSERCMVLWKHGRSHGGWRSLPSDLRQIKLAAWMIDHETARLSPTS